MNNKTLSHLELEEEVIHPKGNLPKGALYFPESKNSSLFTYKDENGIVISSISENAIDTFRDMIKLKRIYK